MRALRLAILLFALGGAEARAHFLFIHIGPMAEGGRSADVFFSEQAEAGDPKFVAKIAHTKLWAQAEPGQFAPLEVRTAADRLRAHLPGGGSVAVVGECEYGVLARPGQTPFLLRYFPKAVAGDAVDLNKLKPKPGARLEVMATFEPGRVRLVALREGKPMPGVVFHTVDADLANEEVTAGADGSATWTPPSPGRYSIYVQHNTKATGEAGGKKYEEIREFATIAFAWPLEGQGADKDAVALFKQGLAARAVWKDFTGFSAKVAGDFDGRTFEGSVKVDAEGSVRLDGINDKPAADWVTGQLESIVMHRRPAAHDDEPVVRFADDNDAHPLGRLLLFEGGQFASSYRVQDGQIRVVNRHIGRSNMTIITLDNMRNAEGLWLPASYVVQSWDDAKGTLKRADTVQDRWQRVGSYDLPAAHTVTSSSDAGISVRQLTLKGHQLSER